MNVIHISWCMIATSAVILGMEPDIPDKKAEKQQVALLVRVCFPDSKQLTKDHWESAHTALAELHDTDNLRLIGAIQQGKIQEQDKKQLQARVARIMSAIDSDAAHFQREAQEQERQQAINRYLIKLGLIALAACMMMHSVWEYCIGVERAKVEDAFFS